MPRVKEIKRFEGGFIIYTAGILKANEELAIKSELKAISAESLGHVFFRVK